MTFNNFEELVHTIENDLGQEFKNDFRNSRKFLAGLTNLPNYIMFSEFDDKKSEWVYNRGGKKEIQYHIFLREGKIGYGLAINSQRGSFNNDDPAEIANDFGKAFKNISDKIYQILPDYSFIIGSQDELGVMEEGEFILFGNLIPITNNTIQNDDYQKLLSDLIKQLEVYKLVYKEKNLLTRNKKNLSIQMESIQEKIDILKYKKQIILQGPPGTGKTRMAEEIANQFIGNKSIVSISDYAEEYIKNFKATDLTLEIDTKSEKLLKEFQDIFPISKLESIDIEDYALGNGSKESFCYYIEKALAYTCRFSPGPAGTTAYGISFNKDNGDVRVDFGENPESYMAKLRKMLVDLASSKDYSKAREMKFWYSFILKVLHSYFPNDYFPVLSKKHLKIFAKIFKIEINNYDDIQLNILINNKFNELKTNLKSPISSIVLMKHLYEKFDLKDENFNDIIISEVVSKGGEYKIIQFHPSYTYEDFVRGINAVTTTNGIIYKAKNKILADYADKAFKNENEKYILIIDEINRANLSSVLGELIYALEYRYKFNDTQREREKAEVLSMYGIIDDEGENKENFTLRLPENLYIIGTMNTADRSVGHIDYAIRRRFAFVEVLPEKLEDNSEIYFNTTDFMDVAKLFIKIGEDDVVDFENAENSDFLSDDFSAKDVALGHSYFIADKKKISEDNKQEYFNMKMKYEVIPILNEYLKDGVFNEKATVKIKEIEQRFA
ncbi:AAA family ATPase [Cloacibacterium caeni]|uniref:AAA family ATPase n=1 Tax=Cloacibacterium caeni TaxID=2004710 RepID=UPI0020201B40|nr:AAA family ATPase [Cloacibacterium caeni]